MAEPSGRRVVVVDGSNLATEGRTVPSLKQLDEAVRAYAQEDPGAEIVVVVDASFEHRINPSERPQLVQAELNGEVVSPPAGAIGRGDAFVLRIAERTGATVLSNDSFQEFHGEHPWLFEPGRLMGGKPVPGIGWIFTPRNPVRGPKSRAVTGKTKRDTLSPPVKAAELARAAKKQAARRLPPVMPDGSAPKVGDVWPRQRANGQAGPPAAHPAVVPADADGAPAAEKKDKRKRSKKGEEQASGPLPPAGPADAGPAPAKATKAPAKAAPAKKAPAVKKAAAKKAAPAKKAAAAAEGGGGVDNVTNTLGVKATSGRAASTKAVAAKAVASKAVPSKVAGSSKAVASKAAKAVPAAVSPSEKDGDSGAAPTKKAAASRAAASKKASAATKAAPAKAAPAKKGAAKKAAAPARGAASPAPETAGGSAATPRRGRRGAATATEPSVPVGAAPTLTSLSPVRQDPALKQAIDQAMAELLTPPPEEPAGGSKNKKSDGKASKRRRRRSGTPPPAVNEPLAFITFVASYPLMSELEGEVVSFTSHGAMVDVDLPGGGLLHCYIPLTAMGDPPPTKAREMLARGERRPFVLVGLDPPRRVAELALPGMPAVVSG